MAPVNASLVAVKKRKQGSCPFTLNALYESPNVSVTQAIANGSEPRKSRDNLASPNTKTPYKPVQ